MEAISGRQRAPVVKRGPIIKGPASRCPVLSGGCGVKEGWGSAGTGVSDVAALAKTMTRQMGRRRDKRALQV